MLVERPHDPALAALSTLVQGVEWEIAVEGPLFPPDLAPEGPEIVPLFLRTLLVGLVAEKWPEIVTGCALRRDGRRVQREQVKLPGWIIRIKPALFLHEKGPNDEPFAVHPFLGRLAIDGPDLETALSFPFRCGKNRVEIVAVGSPLFHRPAIE